MKTRISIPKIKEAALNRPEGYLADYLARGTVEGDWLYISHGEQEQMRQRYAPAAPPANGTCCGKKPLVVHPGILSQTGSFPPLTTQIKTLGTAAVRAVQAISTGKRVVSTQEEIEKRQAVCSACEFFKDSRCTQCGCFLKAKIKIATEHCPKGQW